MTKQSPTFSDFNPTNDERVAIIKGRTDHLIETVRGLTAAFGPEGKRRAALAVTAYEQASMWAVKALFSEDAVAGDDGGSGEGGPLARDEDPPDFDPKTGRDTAP